MAVTFDEATSSKLAELCREFNVQQLRLFGSATREDFDPKNSDLDFLVVFSEPSGHLDLVDQYFGFVEALATLFGRPVDVLEEAAIENRFLMQDAQSTAVTLYAA